ncbi:MAG: phosphatase PAP2 family protein [Candidatus Dormibacteria bacterium]
MLLEGRATGESGGSAEPVAPGPSAGPSPPGGGFLAGVSRRPAWARRSGPMVIVGLAYVVVVAGIMIWRGISVSPDYLLLIFIPVALLSGRFFRFIGDWVPFVAIFLGWEAMRGIVHNDGIAPQVASLANVEKWLFFGHDPSEVLQHAVSGTTLHVLAVAATVVYFCHFAVPLLVGLVLWLKDRAQYLRFVTALLGMCMVGFIFFLLVPTAPPWYAAQQHLLSGVTDLISSQHTLPSAISPYYRLLNPNSTAAFPSLHAAFPTLGWLALRRVYPRGSWILFVWSLLVFVSVVFLGEHYVVDVIGGVILAAAAWWMMVRVVVPRVAILRTARPLLDAPPAAGTLGA